VLLNAGDGRFLSRRDYATGSSPISVAIGDLNGDGKPDLVIANDTDWYNVSVLLNRGDGNFETKRDYGGGLPGRSVAIGDLDGDAAPDLATASSEGNTVSVLLNQGDGSFSARRDYGTPPDPYLVAIADLNGDGRADLVTANTAKEIRSSIYVLLNKGDGGFRHKVYWIEGSPAIGDLNGDGRPDLAMGTGANTLSVLVNRGDGSFQPKLDYRTGRRTGEVAIGDLNSDGKSDLAIANWYPSTVSVLINRPGLCTVQDVRRKTLPAAKRTIARANCRVGKIRRPYSKTFKRVRRGRVISQKPKFGAVLPSGGKVNLVVSRGRKPS
jgi:hypothetical protein